MTEVWDYIDKEYGKSDVLAAQRIMELHNYQFTKAATTGPAKFEELFQIWREVSNNLKKVNLLELLNNAHALQTF